MNSEVEKIKEDIRKTCHKYMNCDDCPYVNINTESCQILRAFCGDQSPYFTPEMTFIELFKTMIQKQCGVENCISCKDFRRCKYCSTLPVHWG